MSDPWKPEDEHWSTRQQGEDHLAELEEELAKGREVRIPEMLEMLAEMETTAITTEQLQAHEKLMTAMERLVAIHTQRVATKRWRRLLIAHGPRYGEWAVQRKHWPDA